jgi:large subunit ribosomal protein L16
VAQAAARQGEGQATRGNVGHFGEFGVTVWSGLDQRARSRRAASRAHYLEARAVCGCAIFPHKPVTAKPAEVRMGTGKGDVADWVAVVKPGTVLFEVGGVPEAKAKVALNRIAHKLPCACASRRGGTSCERRRDAQNARWTTSAARSPRPTRDLEDQVPQAARRRATRTRCGRCAATSRA